MLRKDVPEKYKWNVEDIYPTEEAWEADFKAAQELLDFSAYAGKLGDRQVLLAFLKLSDKFGILLDRLFTYAHLHNDEDKSVEKYSALYSRAMGLYTKYCTESAFFDPEMASLPDEYLKSVAADPEFADYDYQLSRIISGKKHSISEAEERIIGMSREIFDTFGDTFGVIDALDLPLPEIEYEGKTVKLTNGLYGIILHSKDREKRREAYEKYYEAYGKLLNTIAMTYTGRVKSDVLMSRVYKFGSCLEHALFSEDVDRKVYDNLLNAVDGKLASLHRYISDRKKILGVDELHYYDVYAPLVDGVKIKLGYEEAFDYVVKGLAPLGKDYCDLLKKGRDERWIDVEEIEGKRGGAYSSGCYGVHPYVLLNYQPTLFDVFTIAHEMGHALHTYFSSQSQPYAKSQYRIFVAEVASTVNEVLLLKYMLSNAKDPALKKYLLNYHLDSMRATLHRQTMFAEFEYQAHTVVERDEPLTKDKMNKMYHDLGVKYYGEDIVHDDKITFEWARIPHFYTSFYVYKYATGLTAALNIVNRILTEGKPAVDDYFKFLHGGASTDPVSLLKLAGVDLNETAPFEVAMDEFDKTLTEFEKLMGI